MYGVFTEFSGIQFRRCCNECLRRKVRCDGKRPCSNCQRRQHFCEYSLIRRKPPTPSYRSLNKKRDTSTSKPTSDSTAKPNNHVATPISQPPTAGASSHGTTESAVTQGQTLTTAELSHVTDRLMRIVQACETLVTTHAPPLTTGHGPLPSIEEREHPNGLQPPFQTLFETHPSSWLAGPEAILTGMPDKDTHDHFLQYKGIRFDVNHVWTIPMDSENHDALTSATSTHPLIQTRHPPLIGTPTAPSGSTRSPVTASTSSDGAPILMAEPATKAYYLYHPSVIHSLINLYFTRSGCLSAEAQQVRFMRLLAKGRVSPFLLDTTLCIAARFSRHPQIAQVPAYRAALPYFQRAVQAIPTILDQTPTLETIVGFHHLTAWAIGHADLTKLMTFSGISSRMTSTLGLHKIDSPGKRDMYHQPWLGHTRQREMSELPCGGDSTNSEITAAGSLGDSSNLAERVYVSVQRLIFWSIASTDFASALFSSSASMTDIGTVTVNDPEEDLISALLEPNQADFDEQDKRIPAIIPPTFITSFIPRHFTALSLLMGKVTTFRYHLLTNPDQPMDNELMSLNEELNGWYRQITSSVPLPETKVSDDYLIRNVLDILQRIQFHARYQTTVILLNTRNPQSGITQNIRTKTQSIARTIAWNAAEWVCRRILPLARRFRVEFHGPMTGAYFYYASWVYITELLAHTHTEKLRERNTLAEQDHNESTMPSQEQGNESGERAVPWASPPENSHVDSFLPRSTPSDHPSKDPISTFQSVHSASVLNDVFQSSPRLTTSPSPSSGPKDDVRHRSSSPLQPAILQNAEYCVQRLYDIFIMCKQHIPYWSYNRLTCQFIYQQLEKCQGVTEEQLQVFR
ncbi:hypothetical protein IWQ62_004061 [Dispira parvispora]|uniref:Zn(2)-C6 fungal-type domain-containing protein n=1 Tax=Dispira parvispora TaxID=1520584 RepID=A0A9W8E5Z0_9FUNG|nr:hypothetical protein IWQ62_004061 [Dispira parvispora]